MDNKGKKRKDIFTKSRRSEIMASIKSSDTGIEKKVASLLKANNVKFQKGNAIIGKPDFIIKESKIAIFCDGDFWHGRNYFKKDKKKLNDFWRNKIEKNMKRDKKYNTQLRKSGWKVIRFWGSDIIKSPQKCINFIKKSL